MQEIISFVKRCRSSILHVLYVLLVVSLYVLYVLLVVSLYVLYVLLVVSLYVLCCTY